MSANDTRYRVVVCVNGQNAPVYWGRFPDTFRPHRLYRAIPDAAVERNYQVRVLDETGREQVCSAYFFAPLVLPRAADEALREAVAAEDWRERVAELVLRHAAGQAESGELRPQFNPNAAVSLTLCPEGLGALQPVLIDRFLQLSRPIADASKGATPDKRLSDIGSFLYLVEAVKRSGYDRLQETLCVLLDEFAELEERSYDELYLWCLVELCRTDARHIDTYWPLALRLDERYRGEAWSRTDGAHPVEQPCLFTELLFYYFALYTIKPGTYDHRTQTYRPAPPTLGSHLQRLRARLDEGQVTVARRALEGLVRAELNRPAFGDALGLLNAAPPAERKKRG